MAKRVVVTGRGGTGKTTFTALACRFLTSPKLLIDLDPDQCLGNMLGVDLQANDIQTISDILLNIREGKTEEDLASLPLPAKVEYLLNSSCLYESAEFDLITLGVKWTQGCYCAPNDILHALIPGMAGGYAFTILDSPAGLEHLNRRVANEADDVFAVVDSSAKSMRNTEIFRDLAGEIGFRFDNLFVVANHRFPAGEEAKLEKIAGATYVGRIDNDPAVEHYDSEGRSLLELPAASPACVTASAVLQTAGYELAR